MKQGNSKMGMKDTIQEIATEATVASAATKWGMGGGTLTTLGGWFTSTEAAVFIGIIITVGGFIINLYYQRKRDKREQELHEILIKNAKGETGCEI